MSSDCCFYLLCHCRNARHRTERHHLVLGHWQSQGGSAHLTYGCLRPAGGRCSPSPLVCRHRNKQTKEAKVTQIHSEEPSSKPVYIDGVSRFESQSQKCKKKKKERKKLYYKQKNYTLKAQLIIGHYNIIKFDIFGHKLRGIKRMVLLNKIHC